jgi:zinc/manganese transport system ATP-binding protein
LGFMKLMKIDTNKPIIKLINASLDFGGRSLWHDLNLEVKPGEFIALLGPNGSGKTSFLKVLLGLLPLSGGTAEICGREPRRGTSEIGYVPQRQAFDSDLPLRGVDLVRLGLDGHHFGINFSQSEAANKVEEVILEVGAREYAEEPIGLLSGGEQQRLRIAQALVGDPEVLLCDEPLLSLDLSHQQVVSQLIDDRRRKAGTAVIFVTHEINPVLPLVDRVLYLAGGKFAIGTPEKVLTSETLTELYGAQVDVLRVRGRVIVVGTGEAALAEAGGHHASQRMTGDKH